MKIWEILFIGAVLCSGNQGYGAEISGMPFQPGEKITYAIKKYGMKAGEATLLFSGPVQLQDKKTLQIIFTASALNFYDQERIYVDSMTFRPIRVERDLNIWGKREKIVEDYLPGQGRVRITKAANGKTTEQTITRPGQLDNIYCFIYRYRTQGGFQTGETLTLNLPTRDVVIALVGKNNLKIAGKKFTAFFMESQPKMYSIWFDSSNQKIPLRIDGTVGFGNTSMIMTKYTMEKP